MRVTAPDPLFIALCAGIGVAVLTRELARLLRSPPARPTHVADGLPLLLRLCWPVLAALDPWFSRCVPARLRMRLTRELARADLDDSLTAGALVGACLLSALALAAGAWLAVRAVAPGDPASAWLLAASLGPAWVLSWLRERSRNVSRQVSRELPLVMDLLALAVEAGCARGVALRLCAEQCPPGVVQRGIWRATQEVRAGCTQREALGELAARLDHAAVTALVTAVLHSASTGASLSPQLRAQSIQRTEERFARAEKLAMEAPVKMLGPLILCIFPCAFLVLAFPIVSRLMEWG